MRCRTAQRMISARLDGELDERLAEPLTAHVDECARCQRFTDELQRAVIALDRLPVADPRSGFTARVVTALPDLEDAPRGVVGWVGAIRSARAAAAVIGLASGTLLALAMNGSSPARQSDPDEPADVVFAQSFEAIPDDSAEGRYLALLRESEN